MNIGKYWFQKKLNFCLTRNGNAFGEIMGEFVIGQIIAHERRFQGMIAQQQKHEWDR